MKKQDHIAQLDKLLSETWMEQLDNELDPSDTMGQLNRMALLTGELAGRLGSIIEDLEKKKQKK
jgi:5,10-methenyltetrahydromethanopterin hydrogenase